MQIQLFQKVHANDIAVFCRQLSVLLNAGVTLVEAISILKGQGENHTLNMALEDIHDRLQRGNILSEAMMRHDDVFAEFLINMVKVGEASGTLDTVMVKLADYYERDNKINQKVRSAMTYPVILAILTVAVIILLMVKVLPMFTGILTQMGEEMPALTKGLIAVSNFFIENFTILLLLIVGLFVFFRYFGKSDVGRYWFDWVKLSVPGVKTVTLKIVTARFSRSLSILLKSGIPIIGAVDIIRNMIGNRVVERRFEVCSTAIKEGRGIAVPISELNIFPGLLVHMITIGENSGELDEMLGRTAGFFDAEVEESIDRLTVMIEPLLIIVLGVVVGTIIISIMLPMIGIMTAL